MAADTTDGVSVPSFWWVSQQAVASIGAPDPLALDTWVHVAVTTAGTTGRLYLDGLEVVSGPILDLGLQTRTQNWIGRNSGAGTPYSPMALSNLRIFSRALSASEVYVARLGLFANDASLLDLGFNCSIFTPKPPTSAQDRCGCPGYALAASALVGGASFSADSIADCPDCQSREAIVLDGRSGYVDLGTLTFDASSVTVLLWLKAAAATQDAGVFNFGSGATLDHLFLRFGPAGELELSTNPGTPTYLSQSSALALNAWVYIAVAISGTSASIYFDGVLEVSGSVDALGIQRRATCWLGQSNAGHYVDGAITDFKMYSRPLSAAEVWETRRGTLAEADADILPFFACSDVSSNCTATTTTTTTPAPSSTTTTPASRTTPAPTTTPAPRLISNTTLCYERNLSLSATCGLDSTDLILRACATTEAALEAEVMQLPAGGSVLDATATCTGFYAWVCAELGTVAYGGGEDCAFACRFLSEGARAGLAGGCSVQEGCVESSALDLHHAAGALCYDEARYALHASCVASEGFAANVELLLANTANCSRANTSAPTETLFVAGFISPPAWAAPAPLCSDSDDCAVACFRSPFEIKHQTPDVTMTSVYRGPCDCSVRGVFKGAVGYENGLELRALNAEGAVLTLTPLTSVNQIRVKFEFGAGEACVYLWDVEQGSLLGLPVEKAVEMSDESTLAFLGLDEALAQEILAGRRRSAGSALLDNNKSTRRLAAAEADCPQEESDCRFACMAAGLTASTFGNELALLPDYDDDDGACDCALVFPQDLGGASGMAGTMAAAAAGSDVSFEFPGGIDVLALGGADPRALADVTLRPRGGGSELMRLDFAPAAGTHCTYLFGVGGGLLLGVQGASAEEVAAEEAAALAAEEAAAAGDSTPAPDKPGVFDISVAEAEQTAEYIGAVVGATTAAVVLTSVITTDRKSVV